MRLSSHILMGDGELEHGVDNGRALARYWGPSEVSLPWHLHLSIFFCIAQLLYHICPIPFTLVASNRCLKCRVL